MRISMMLKCPVKKLCNLKVTQRPIVKYNMCWINLQILIYLLLYIRVLIVMNIIYHAAKLCFLQCPYSRRYKVISLFRIPFPKTSDSEHTPLLKLEAREAWKTAILHTRQDLQSTIFPFVNITLSKIVLSHDEKTQKRLASQNIG